MTEVGLRNEAGEITYTNVLAHKGCLLSFTLLVIFRRLCTLEAQQCTSQPGGSEENDNRVKNEGAPPTS